MCHLTAMMVLFGAFGPFFPLFMRSSVTDDDDGAIDVGWLCISRFIVLDSMLLFFTFLIVFCLTKFHNQQYQYGPFFTCSFPS